ncbi:MAG: hypothetical protein ABIG84_03040 [archaeon]
MDSREIELPSEKDDYEIIPVTPLRRIEKRLEAIETSKSINSLEKFIDKVIGMVEMNQKIVDEVVRANQGLREDISILISKIDASQTKMAEFVDIIKEAGEQETGENISKEMIETVVNPLLEKMENASNKTAETNTQMVETLSSIEKRLKTMQLGGQGTQGNAATSILQRRRFPPQAPPPL